MDTSRGISDIVQLTSRGRLDLGRPRACGWEGKFDALRSMVVIPLLGEKR